jgi:hypothetical protein
MLTYLTCIDKIPDNVKKGKTPTNKKTDLLQLLQSEQQNPTFDEPLTSAAGLAAFEGRFNVLIPPPC